MYYVRWFDPGRAHPLKRDFHTKAERDAFLARLPYLYATGTYPKAKLPGWAARKTP